MRCRYYQSVDAAAVDEIFERCHGHFNRPRLTNCADAAVVENNGKIIAFGALELIAEATMILDNAIPKKLQVQALSELIKTADVQARIKGFSDVYASPDSNKFSAVLQKHFGFKPCSPFLILNLED